MPDMLAMLAILPPDASDIPDGSPPNMSAVEPIDAMLILIAAIYKSKPNP